MAGLGPAIHDFDFPAESQPAGQHPAQPEHEAKSSGINHWEWNHTMLRLALFFLVVSIIAAIFGFGGVAAASADIARILFFIAIVIFVVLLIAGLMAGSTLW